MKSLKAKLIVLGSSCVGKTSVVVRLAKGTFDPNYKMTMGATFFQQKPVTVGNYNVTLCVWDTCGEERFKAMTPFYYKKASVAVLMYDITSEDSFFEVMYWVRELREQVDNKMALCLIGNKTDLGEMREVKTDHAEKYALSIDATHFETSALANTGVNEAFSEIYKQVVRLYETHNSNSGIMDWSPVSPLQVQLQENPEKEKKKWCCW